MLDASWNLLESAPVGNLRMLKSLNLSDNHIEGVIEDLAHLANLTYIDLSSNKISGIWDPCASSKTLETYVIECNTQYQSECGVTSRMCVHADVYVCKYRRRSENSPMSWFGQSQSFHNLAVNKKNVSLGSSFWSNAVFEFMRSLGLINGNLLPSIHLPFSL